MKPSILYLGRGTIAVNCLEILEKKGLRPKMIICDTYDSGEDSWTKSLYKKALEIGYKDGENLVKERRVNRPDVIQQLTDYGPYDIIFSIQPYAIFRKPFISLAKKYVVNMHMAPLPKLRGVAPCSHAILDGLEEMGVSLHLIQDEGIDNGPILFQRKFAITNKDTAWTLFNRCVVEGTKLFQNNVDAIVEGDINPQPQDDSQMTYHPMGELDFTECEVSLQESAEKTFRYIRSRIFPPFQLPYFIHDEKKVMIKDVRIERKLDSSEIKITYKDKKYLLHFPDGVLIIDKYSIE